MLSPFPASRRRQPPDVVRQAAGNAVSTVSVSYRVYRHYSYMLLLYRRSKNIVPQNELYQWRTHVCLTVYYTDDEDSTDARNMKRGPRLVPLQGPCCTTFPLVTMGQTADV